MEQEPNIYDILQQKANKEISRKEYLNLLDVVRFADTNY
jgi:hypothetical protein